MLTAQLAPPDPGDVSEVEGAVPRQAMRDLSQWKREQESGTVIELTLGANGATMGQDDMFGDCQP